MPTKPSAILIKKYGNRRLYDTASSRYVNLDDLAAHIRAGREVRVVDAKSGQRPDSSFANADHH